MEKDLKRETDFLMSFRDFAELSFFSRASGDIFLRSFSFILKRCVSVYFSKLITECRNKMMTGGN